MARRSRFYNRNYAARHFAINNRLQVTCGRRLKFGCYEYRALAEELC
jgi:hypothetical protein